MSTEDQKARVDALMALADEYASARSDRDWQDCEGWKDSVIAECHTAHDAAREALRSALMSNAAPEIDMSAERVEAARRNALEQAAKVVEDMRDLKEAARAQKAADEAISRDDKGDMLHRLRHCSTVSLFNGALERAAKAIRALADPLQGKETP